ncbi:MAG: hypothetical protein EBQ95_05770 [Gammaproteobacteria bacterium]|nr:hypothetical protein [Gammaproteobacteria bacterium]
MYQQDESEPLWILIWRKGWQTQDWLTTSFFSGVLITEFYKILISVYPLCITEFWILLGANSLFIIGLLNILALICLSLILGWFIYSIQLASIAIHTFENQYQPLVDMWKIQNPIYYDLLKTMITQEEFVSLSQWLNHDGVPESIKEYLLNEEACENLEKVISLLQLILTSENRDINTKQQLLELLGKHFDDPSQNERIENICHLGLLLWDGAFLNSEKFIDILKNSSAYTNYLPQIQNAYQQPDLLQQLLETPQLMIYYAKCIEQYPNQPQETAKIIHSLIPYLNGEYPLPIEQEIFEWLCQTYHDSPETFLKIWHKIHDHQHLEFIQSVIKQHKNLPNLDKNLMDITNIENPRMEMVSIIKAALHFKIPFELISQCQHLQTLHLCLECCLINFPNDNVIKIMDNLEIIEKKLKTHPDSLQQLINRIFHPQSHSIFHRLSLINLPSSNHSNLFFSKNA